MVQWLTRLTALPEDLVCFQEPTWQFTAICNSSARRFNPLSGLHGLYMHVIYKYACRQNNHIYNEFLKLVCQSIWMQSYEPSFWPASTLLKTNKQTNKQNKTNHRTVVAFGAITALSTLSKRYYLGIALFSVFHVLCEDCWAEQKTYSCLNFTLRTSENK